MDDKSHLTKSIWLNDLSQSLKESDDLYEFTLRASSEYQMLFFIYIYTLLSPKVKSTDEKEKDENRIFLITTYHPTFNNVNDIVNTNWNLLDRSSSTRPLMNTNVVRGFS